MAESYHKHDLPPSATVGDIINFINCMFDELTALQDNEVNTYRTADGIARDVLIELTEGNLPLLITKEVIATPTGPCTNIRGRTVCNTPDVTDLTYFENSFDLPKDETTDRELVMSRVQRTPHGLERSDVLLTCADFMRLMKGAQLVTGPKAKKILKIDQRARRHYLSSPYAEN